METRSEQKNFPDEITMGQNCRIDARAIIGHPLMRECTDDKVIIGDNLQALSGSVLYKGTKLGNNAIIGHNSIIREENTVGDDFNIWNNSVLDYGCKIGNNVKIHCNCYVAQYTVIEDNVFLAPGVTIGNDPHPGCSHSRECLQASSVTIKKGAQIGVNATLLPGVTIGEKALIGAGSVVSRDVPAETVVTGNPASGSKKTYDLNCTTGITNKPYRKD